mgnify:CR=1 FL=1
MMLFGAGCMLGLSLVLLFGLGIPMFFMADSLIFMLLYVSGGGGGGREGEEKVQASCSIRGREGCREDGQRTGLMAARGGSSDAGEGVVGQEF